jgi:hypothetical protein
MKDVFMAKKEHTLKLTRDVTKKECPWLDDDLKAGQTCYLFRGCTYGCIANGVAVTLPGSDEFMEIPYDSFTKIDQYRPDNL